MSQLITMLMARFAHMGERTNREQGAVTVEYGVLIIAIGASLLAAAMLFFTGLGGWLTGLVDDIGP